MSGKLLTRRTALAGLGGLAAMARPARAATTLTVLSHEVNKSSATTGKGGDVLANWRKANNCEVSWITLGVQETSDRLLREASLNRTSIDVAFQTFTTARALSLMAPLEPYLAADPIDGVGVDMADFPPALVEALKYDGKLRGVPTRVSVLGLAYNEALFEERGITSVPKTFEELVEAARKLTYTRADGSKVYGLLYPGAGLLSGGLVAFARCFDGDYITPDLKLTANEPPCVKSLEALAALYKNGVFPPEMMNHQQEDTFGWVQQGRAAMVVLTYARIPGMNDPHASKFPGRIKPMAWPKAAAVADKPYQAVVESWSMVMPQTAAPERKQLAWSFIKALSTTQAAIAMSLNGNGPARLSAYTDPSQAGIPFMALIAAGLKTGHISLPAFPNETKAGSILLEECQNVVLGRKPAQQAMDQAVARIRPLL